MPSVGEVIFDLVLCPLYIYLLIQIAISSDEYFKTPFYVFFIATGIYSIMTVFFYQIVRQFVDQYWTRYIWQLSYGLNTFGAVGATFGKALIAIHRYYVIRSHDFAEKKWSRSFIRYLLIAQFTISLLLASPVIPSSLVYKNQKTEDQVVALSVTHTLILKAIAFITYTLYIICNSVCTVLTSRELFRLRSILQENATTSQKIMKQQRNMFIIVVACSLSHLTKAVQQLIIGVGTYFGSEAFTTFVWSLYPLVNGLSTYAAPFFLVLLSPTVRSRVLFIPLSEMSGATVDSTTSRYI